MVGCRLPKLTMGQLYGETKKAAHGRLFLSITYQHYLMR
jgi:hypothetical protein